jgi:hypothetical protein
LALLDLIAVTTGKPQRQQRIEDDQRQFGRTDQPTQVSARV